MVKITGLLILCMLEECRITVTIFRNPSEKLPCCFFSEEEEVEKDNNMTYNSTEPSVMFFNILYENNSIEIVCVYS